MDWLVELFTKTDSVAHVVALYAIVIAMGVYLGKIKFGGISLGVTFVLFAGILAGHIHFTAPITILNFCQDFGLILFVFMIGLQVGPGFFESFKKDGITMNGLAAVLILLNIGVMFACYYLFFDTTDKQNLPMMIGTMYGAVTNTPGLGAASEALGTVFSQDETPQIASGYACAYPLGVVGIILATIAVRFLTHSNLKKEEDKLKAEEAENPNEKPHTLHLRVSNIYLDGRNLMQIHDFLNRDFVCSRYLHDGLVSIPNRDTIFKVGDELMIVCAEVDVEPIKAFIGPEVDTEWNVEYEKQPMVARRIVVTKPSMNGKTLGKMHFSSLYGVNVTRITRHGIDLFAGSNHHFHIGDRVLVVGPEDNVRRVAEMMGDEVKRLNAPNIATIFIGVLVGIIFGSLPTLPYPECPFQ